MKQYIDKAAIVAEIRKRLLPTIRDKHYDEWEEGQDSERIAILEIIDTLEVKESDETAEAFARIIRTNLTGIDKDVQYKFEQLYKKITGKKMYQGYKD